MSGLSYPLAPSLLGLGLLHNIALLEVRFMFSVVVEYGLSRFSHLYIGEQPPMLSYLIRVHGETITYDLATILLASLANTHSTKVTLHDNIAFITHHSHPTRHI